MPSEETVVAIETVADLTNQINVLRSRLEKLQEPEIYAEMLATVGKFFVYRNGDGSGNWNRYTRVVEATPGNAHDAPICTSMSFEISGKNQKCNLEVQHFSFVHDYGTEISEETYNTNLKHFQTRVAEMLTDGA